MQEHYKMITNDLGKQKSLDSGSKAIHQINFTGNIENQSPIFFIIEGAKETALDLLQETVKYSNFIFCFNIKGLNIKLH